jgi:hypothetical protein
MELKVQPENAHSVATSEKIKKLWEKTTGQVVEEIRALRALDEAFYAMALAATKRHKKENVAEHLFELKSRNSEDGPSLAVVQVQKEANAATPKSEQEEGQFSDALRSSAVAAPEVLRTSLREKVANEVAQAKLLEREEPARAVGVVTTKSDPLPAPPPSPPVLHSH